MWACPRMTQKRADLIRGFGRKDVLELARLLLDLRIAIQGRAVGKQRLRKPVPADDVGGALAPARRKLDNHAAVTDRNRSRFQSVMAWIYERLVIVRLQGMRRSRYESHLRHLFDRYPDRQGAMDLHTADFRNLAVLRQDPEFLQNFIELFFIRHREHF